MTVCARHLGMLLDSDLEQVLVQLAPSQTE